MEVVKPWLIGKLQLEDIREASYEEQREHDIDLWGEREGKWIPIEVKIRATDYPDLLIETVSNTTTHSEGWIYKSNAKILAYVVVKDGALVKGSLYKLDDLRKWWLTDGVYQNFPEKYGRTDGLYKSKNRATPWKAIPVDCLLYGPKFNAIDDYFRNYGLDFDPFKPGNTFRRPF